MSNVTEYETLDEYAQALKDAGFKVWKGELKPHEWLVYEKNGLYGTFQRSEYEDWSHCMPIKPSREHGSSMYVDPPKGVPVWSVEAAEHTAREVNVNRDVGAQHNARSADVKRYTAL